MPECGDVARLRVIQRLGPWPTQPLVVRVGIDAATTSRVVQRLLDAHHDPEFASVLQASAIHRLVAVGSDHCSTVRDAMDALGSSRSQSTSPSTSAVRPAGQVT